MHKKHLIPNFENKEREERLINNKTDEITQVNNYLNYININTILIFLIQSIFNKDLYVYMYIYICKFIIEYCNVPKKNSKYGCND